MPVSELFAIIVYVSILLGIAYFSLRKQMSSSDFIMGGRSLNFWLTALAAHASDMSSWLFMAYPQLIYTTGLFGAWSAVGLTFFMYLNWQFVAPRIRTMTERYSSLTFSSFFESRFRDTSGVIRIFTAIMSLAFFTVYVSAGLISLGIVVNTLFGVHYIVAITVGIFIVIPYLYFGGYQTLAWIDLFQGMFLLCVIGFVPLYALGYVGGFDGVFSSLTERGLSTSLLPSGKSTLLAGFYAFAGWGLGYFGQPHIVTKFMGISSASEIPKAKYVGISWQILALGSATLIGIIGVPYFQGTLVDTQLVFVNMVRQLFSPMISAFILCAGLAATISTMDSQILVLASTLTEDLYKKVFRKTASSKELLWCSRITIVIVSALAYVIAFIEPASIYQLVFYAWQGLGSSFGPVLLFALYSKRANKYGAWAGILSGGICSAFWMFVPWDIPALIPSFSLSCIAIWLFSFISPSQYTFDQLEKRVHL